MEEQSKPSRSLSFFKWVLLVFGILTTISMLLETLARVLPGSGQSYPPAFLILLAVAAALFLASFFALQNRKRYGRWLAVLTFSLADINLILGLVWYLIVMGGPKTTFETVMAITLNILQFLLFGWGALTFAFPPKVIANDPSAELLVPPPPPSFD